MQRVYTLVESPSGFTGILILHLNIHATPVVSNPERTGHYSCRSKNNLRVICLRLLSYPPSTPCFNLFSQLSHVCNQESRTLLFYLRNLKGIRINSQL